MVECGGYNIEDPHRKSVVIPLIDRAGWKGGRFSVDFETASIYGGLRDWQRWTGDQIYYYRFAYDQSSVDPVYGEADAPNGRIYFEQGLIPALHVIHVEGDNDNTEQGFYTNDRAHVTMSYDQLKRLGLNNMDINTQNYLKDRFVYDGKVFRVISFQILGQIQQRDIVIALDATQVKPSEMVNDIQFAQYAIPHVAQSGDNFEQQWNVNVAKYDPYNNGQNVYPLNYKVPAPAADFAKQLAQVTPRLNGAYLQYPIGTYGSGLYGQGGYGGYQPTS